MKLFLKFGLVILWSIVLTFYLHGCVDVDNHAVTPVDLRTSVKFVDLTNLGASMNVAVDGGSVATVNYKDNSTYLDLAAGTRFFAFTYGSVQDTMRKALPPDMKCTFFTVYDASNGDASRTYILANERNTYSGSVKYVPQSVLIRFINLSNDTAAASVAFALQNGHFPLDTVGEAARDSLTDGISFSGSTPYMQTVLSTNPQFLVTSGSGATLGGPTPLTAEGRYTVVLFGNSAAQTLQVKVLKED